MEGRGGRAQALPLFFKEGEEGRGRKEGEEGRGRKEGEEGRGRRKRGKGENPFFFYSRLVVKTKIYDISYRPLSDKARFL
jgi:hypothetical protein